MIKIEKIDTRSKAQVNRFVRLPFRLYKNDPFWVPPILVDNEAQLNRKKHPFYEHSDADFFMAVRDGQDVGRIASIENRRFNQYHATHQAQFYFFESEDDQEIANDLFEALFDWARQRGLDAVVGPKGFGPLDGYGMLIEGFTGHQMMTQMNYNPPSYPPMLEALGFTKEVDFISCWAALASFNFPQRARMSYAGCTLPPNVQPGDLEIWYWNEALNVYEYIGGDNDENHQRINFYLNHFSRYVVAGPE